jgi:hypothetical protein
MEWKKYFQKVKDVVVYFLKWFFIAIEFILYYIRLQQTILKYPMLK